ncbi:ribosome small subunit-dependent GTPase A [Desulfuromonas carbonis]|uniref:ribosome small subunit-dependent GTPase A n=1 Tax=Desulfuromonas sp. DDH964 TaxID=1823759 RepID=UPI00078C0DCB|nr:ribosome small subunit-dependent GTPase A [Desulfuromonas sp. DDH964]AMV73248.1 ribosome small subunit biogenesis GTPase RsgA [Desulfuromonas sp. DDH964]
MELEQLGWDQTFAADLARLADPLLVPARVARASRDFYTLLGHCGEIDARLPGKLRREPPVVGDWVACTLPAPGQSGVIRALLPRRSCFARVAAGRRQSRGGAELQVLAANIDTALIITGLDGDFNLRRLERYLTLAWESGARPAIVLNKADLCAIPESFRDQVAAIAGEVPVHLLSAATGSGLAALDPYLAPGKTVALLGSSGVGKSTLLNRLAGHALQPTGAISASDGKGRHTTTHRELFLLPGGGLLIDNPGMRELQLFGEETVLADTFEEIHSLAAGCRFADCRHQQEPGCAVLAAAAAGELAPQRLASFQRQQQELEYLNRRATSSAEAVQRQKWRAIHKEVRRFQKRRDD